jgi:chromosome segregation ATPase
MSPCAKQRLSGIVKISAVVLVVSLGIWGCARKPAESTADRLRSLEARCVKLEQDYRTVAQARDSARKDLAALEEEVNRQKTDAANHEATAKERDELRRQVETVQFERERLSKQLRDRTNERDQLNRDLNVRTAERDTALSRYEKFRKTLQTIVAQDEGSAPQQQGTDAPAAGPALNTNS